MTPAGRWIFVRMLATRVLCVFGFFVGIYAMGWVAFHLNEGLEFLLNIPSSEESPSFWRRMFSGVMLLLFILCIPGIAILMFLAVREVAYKPLQKWFRNLRQEAERRAQVSK